jgi:hypothetical protein
MRAQFIGNSAALCCYHLAAFLSSDGMSGAFLRGPKDSRKAPRAEPRRENRAVSGVYEMLTAGSLPTSRDFFNWVSKEWVGRIGFVYGLAYIFIGFYSSQHLIPDRAPTLNAAFLTPQLWPSLLECVALFPLTFACAMLRLPAWMLSKKNENKAAIESCHQFKWSLVALTTSWFLFYFVIFLFTYYTMPRNTPAWVNNVKPLIDLLNNMQGVFLFACYWILTTKTTEMEAQGKTQNPASKSHMPLWGLYSFLLWGVFVFLVLGFAMTGASPQGPVRPILQLLSGLWVGAALALLVGCMESPFLSQPRGITVLLYFYAALQVSYVEFFGSNSQTSFILQTTATVTSLPLKFLLIGFWAWTFENGLLAFFMRRRRSDLDEVGRSWLGFSAEAPGAGNHE